MTYKGMDLGNLEGSGQLILESMGEGVCVLDSRGRTTFANPAAAELTGYGPGELTGAIHHELLEHSTQSGELYPVEECPVCGAFLRGEPSGSSGALFRGKDGAGLIVGYSSDPLVKGGKVTGAVVVFREVAVRRAEKELKGQGRRRAKEPGGSDEIFRLLVEGVRDYAIFMLDPEGRVTTWNAGAERTKGYEAGEIIGEHFSVFYTEEDLRRGHPEEELRIVVSQGRYEEEGWRVRKDGTRFWATVLITALRDDDGRLRGFSKITRDVTERKRAQEALWESEERYRVVAETASDVIVMIDEDSRILFINSAAEKVFGYSREELLDRRLTMLMPEPLRPLHEAALERYIKSGERRLDWSSIQLPGLHKSGREVPLELSFGEFVKDGRRFFTGFIRDTTERKKIEQELRESEERYRAVIEQAAEGIVLIDADNHHILEANSESQRLFGYSAEELAGLTIYDLVAHDRESVDHNIELTLKEGNHTVGERRYRRKDGSLVDVIVGGSAISYGGRRVLNLVIHDITERKRAEEKLMRSESSLRAAQRMAHLGDWEYGLDEDRGRWSDELYRIFGFSPQEFVPTYRMFFDLVHPDDRRAVRREVFGALRDGRQSSRDYRIVRSDGEVRSVHTEYRVVRDGSGRPVSMAGTLQDITERKQMEEDLRRSNEELEQFAYIASHDLQEPLRMVSSYTQLLARRYKGQLDEDADEFIGYAVDGAERMQRLVNGLLTYSRVGTRGKEFSPTDLTIVVEAATANLRLAIEESGARVTSDTLPTVIGDRTQLTQLFQNLIGNAVKFRGAEPPEIHVGAERRNEEWVISVRDNGIGIDPQYADKVFVIFKRLHGWGEYEGTGLGLAICKRIVERHRGRMWVESAPDEGSTFYFTLPFSKRDG